MKARLLLFGSCLLLLFGCRFGNVDVNSTTLTIGKLDTIGMVIIAMYKDGTDCTKFRSINDFIGEADNAKMIMKSEIIAHRYEKDAWGNQFHWKVKSNPDANVISVISNGPNGIFQHGSGDDLSLIVTIPRHGEPKAEIHQVRK
jgi:hypothetical protein